MNTKNIVNNYILLIMQKNKNNLTYRLNKLLKNSTIKKGRRYMQKLKLTNDFIFKKVFGKKGNESILKDLLEAILKIKIEKIEIQAEVELERELIDDKTRILDIEATIDDSTVIDIEMQMQNQYNMKERTLYYWSGLYYTGLQKNENYKINKRAITINIMNFDMFKEGPYHEKVELRREYKNILLTDKLEIHFIQLTKFMKEARKEEDKDLWNWLTFICNKNEEEVREIMEENEEIKKANEQLEYLTGDEAVRRMAFLREKAERDYVTNMSGAREEGIEEGKKEGLKKGIKEGEKKKTIEIAKEMLKEEIEKEKIIKITGLTKEELEEIIKENEN